MRILSSSLAALAATVLLSGCMGGVNTSTPAVSGMSSASHVATMSKVQGDVHPVLKVSGGQPMTTCPSEYTGGCYSITKGNPVSFEWCVSSSGNCSSGLVDSWQWTAAVTTGKKNKPVKKNPSATWSSNPANPDTVTISTTSKKATGKVKFAVTLSTCDVSGSLGCFSDFVVYGIAI